MALAAEKCGHEIRGWDADHQTRINIERKEIRYREAGAQDLLNRSRIKLVHPEILVAWADLIFVVVQTPHERRFEGDDLLPTDRADFDYTYLSAACGEIADHAAGQSRQTTIAVVSTCLPGSIDREVKPKLNTFVDLVYNPSLIAMGTAIEDFLHPEMVIVGVDSPLALEALKDFYAPIHDAPLAIMPVRDAELTKVAYNVYIGMKLEFANTLAMFADSTGCNVDTVTDALGLAKKRLISTAYMRAGLGDAGGCHPRDCIALSHLACQPQRNITYDLFGSIMVHREEHSMWIASIIADEAHRANLPTILLGKAYKPESNIVTGSAATLLVACLRHLGMRPISWDPHIDSSPPPDDHPAVFVVATDHRSFRLFRYPEGSTIVDPWGTTPPQPGCRLVQPGRRPD
jgi:UDPglucose 6-dehydrogenase